MKPPVKPTSLLHEPLTKREIEIVRLFHKGYGNRAIAKELGILEGTVRKFHMINIYRKFGFPAGGAGNKKSRLLMKVLCESGVKV